MTKKSIALFQVILTALGVVLFVWLIAKNFPLSGALEASAQLGFDSQFISKITPLDRIVHHDGYQGIIASPVYITVRAPQWYNYIDVIVAYREQGRALHGIGAQTGPGFSYNIIQPDSIETETGKRAVVTFATDTLYKNANTIQLLLDSQAQADNGELFIDAIDIKLYR